MSRFPNTNDILTFGTDRQILVGIHASCDLVELFSPERQSFRQYSLRLLRTELAGGQVAIESSETLKGSIRGVSDKSPAFKTFLYRNAIVQKLENAISRGASPHVAIHILLGTELALPSGEVMPMCSQREAYRLLQLSKVSREALMPGYAARGNRVKRYGDRMIEIVLQHTENLYAVPFSRITLLKLTELVNYSAYAEGILPQCKRVTRKYVRSVVIKYWNVDLDIDRLDPRVAKSKKAVAANRIRPGAPLNRVEMDALHLPFVVQTEFGVNENVWVLMAIDADTSHPLSWLLLNTNPTTDDTFRCLERAIYPKSELFAKLGIASEVDPFGAMLNLVWDNGSENSRTRLAAVTQVGINPEWAPTNSGHLKPFIERLNQSVKKALQELPGCTRFDGVDGARTAAARDEQLLTFNQLERWLVRFLFEKWPNVPLERFNTEDYELDGSRGLTPAERWKNYEATCVLPLAPPREKWRMLRYVMETRRLNIKTGVSLWDYDFRGDNLKVLVTQYGPSTKVDIHYDPFDYRYIHVPDKHSGQWLVLVNAEVTENTPALSFADAKKRRKERAETYTESSIAKKFDSDKNELVLAGASARRTRKKTRQDITLLSRKDDAIKRRDAAPFLPSVAPASLQDSFICDDAIPNFGTHHKPSKLNE